eukprot:scaffold1707_cov39-Cyclotella_meneghiniana.AAC.7
MRSPSSRDKIAAQIPLLRRYQRGCIRGLYGQDHYKMEDVLKLDISEIHSDMLHINEFTEVAHYFGLEIPQQHNEADDEYKTILKDIIMDSHNATLEDIRRNIQECKNPQQYEESEIALRYIWGLKILRAGQLINGLTVQIVELRG